MSRVADVYREARCIYRTEGLVPLARRAFAFSLHWLWKYETYYLYETDILMERSEAHFVSRLPPFTMHVVSRNEEAEELEADGLEFRSQVSNARERLEKGAIAFCFFVGKELANMAWVALSQEALASFNDPPLKVDFAAGEAYSGGVWTSPEYRGLGFNAYCYFKILEFMRERGKLVSRAAIAVPNVVSQRATGKIGTNVYAEAHYLRVLWWKAWKERPLRPHQ
jgi:GNAT superfamily N-acetyltransferase